MRPVAQRWRAMNWFWSSLRLISNVATHWLSRKTPGLYARLVLKYSGVKSEFASQSKLTAQTTGKRFQRKKQIAATKNARVKLPKMIRWCSRSCGPSAARSLTSRCSNTCGRIARYSQEGLRGMRERRAFAKDQVQPSFQAHFPYS